ncbi:MAG: tRNA pseudouridine(55) synthase TruB [Candidatus Saccharimonadales bacterium]
MQGVLLVDKPPGWTSFDVVNYVRKIVAQASGKKPKNIKVGHTGTLDPFATGLLVLVVGSDYTRRSRELSKLDKTYDVTMCLGQTSSTGDEEGQKRLISERVPTETEIRHVLSEFSGDIMQRPPSFSAIKINGQRAYRLARAGKPMILEARLVKIYENSLKTYSYPLAQFSSHVGSGTYIRSLVEDMGKKLKTGAYVSELCRLSVGNFYLENALSVNNLSEDLITARLQSLD